jgi:symplekin
LFILRLFSKILLETPCLTDSCLEELKKICLNESRSFIGISTLKDLIISRPNDRVKLVYFLLDLCYSLNVEVRRNAIRVVRILHQRDDLKLEIEVF